MTISSEYFEMALSVSDPSRIAILRSLILPVSVSDSKSYPTDMCEFMKCYEMFEKFPDLFDSVKKQLANSSRQWKTFMYNWDALCQLKEDGKMLLLNSSIKEIVYG